MVGLLACMALAAAGCATARGAAGSPPSGATLSRSDVQHLADSLISDARFANAHWGVLIVNPAGGDTLYSHEAGKLFMPASNQKILTTAVALAQLGPGFRFRTVFAARGPVHDGTLAGDLIVTGRGDPSVSTSMRTDALAPLRDIADSLMARGVQRVSGRILEAGDAFPGPNIATGWEWDDLDAAYGAGVDQLFLNEGFVRVVARGAVVGSAPVVIVSPGSSYPVVRSEATTVAASPPSTAADTSARKPTITVTRDTVDDGIVVQGAVAVGDSSVATISLRVPARAYLFALRDALAERGVAVDGGVGPPLPDSLVTELDTLVVMESPPLAAILPFLSKPSQNQIAEILFRTLGLEKTGSATPDSARRVIVDQLLAWGASPAGFAVHDGSGLSRHNLVSPETIVKTLDAMRRDSAADVFMASLPIAGVDGTLERRMRGTPAEGNVRAKTGTLARARSLSGFVTTRDGELLIFSMLANNFTTSVDDVTRVQDALSAALAGMTWRQR
jgi:D-alanyl-D-alanine carboxypeptidase/D-alanyl-D-alanine-endopeptidase (penicillin-binding protein 4)